MTSSTALTKVVASKVPSSLQELHQVQRGQVARGVVQVHVLRARVGRGDPAGLGAGVPVVDRVVVLDAGVGALPGGLGDLAEQLLGVDGLDDLAGRAGRAGRTSSPSSTARMNSSETRTELLAFWYWTLVMSLPPRSMSNPASRSARILSSSRALVSMNSSMSGWSTSRTTIFAARRVAPPDLMVPAEASAPRMKRDRAGGGAAGGQQLLGGADAGEVQAGAGAALEDQPLLPVPVQDRVHRVVDGQDEAGARPAAGDAVPTLNQTGRVEAEAPGAAASRSARGRRSRRRSSVAK